MNRRVRIALGLLAGFLPFQVLTEPHQLGTNLEIIAPWGPQILFVDAMKRAAPWTAFELGEGGQWDVDVEVPADAQGYPLELPFDPGGGAAPVGVATFLFNEMQDRFPSGDYTLMFEGTGILLVTGTDIEEVFFTRGAYPVTLDASVQNNVMILLIESDALDPIRNIRFILPGFEDVYESEPFYPGVISKLAPFSVVRFSQTMRTNDGDYPCDRGAGPGEADCVKVWENRPRVDWFTQGTERGIALEYVLDLANVVGFDPWICIQHGADDNYVTEMARMVKTRLDADLRCFVELSNELWNYSFNFPQSRWAEASGLQQGLSTIPELARIRFTAKRSAEIFRIFETELGAEAATRLVKVLPGFQADWIMNDELLTAFADPLYNPTQVEADALAIGAYFGVVVADEIFFNNEQGTITVEEILQRGRDNLTIARPDPFSPGETLWSLAEYVAFTAAVTRAHDIPLIAYEGGQAIHQRQGWNNDLVLGQKCVDANRHPEMAEIYREMLEIWEREGGGLLMHYSLINRASLFWGSYGSLETTDQEPSSSPKYQALLDWIADRKPTGPLQD